MTGDHTAAAAAYRDAVRRTATSEAAKVAQRFALAIALKSDRSRLS